MALDGLLASITEEANHEVTRILDEAKTKAQSIVDTEKQKAEQLAESLREKGKKEQQRIKEKILASARRQSRMYLSHAKEEIISQCIQEIRDTLTNMKGLEYRRYVEKLINHALADKDKYNVIGTKEEDKEIAKKLGMKLIERREGNGGVILRSIDGHKEIDLTFDFILERETENVRIMIARNLFDENND